MQLMCFIGIGQKLFRRMKNVPKKSIQAFENPIYISIKALSAHTCSASIPPTVLQQIFA